MRRGCGGGHQRTRTRISLMGLTLHPISLAQAKQFVAMWHSRLPIAGAGHMWSTAVVEGVNVVGVVIAGRPTARALDNGLTIEITRCATPGVDINPNCRNAASMLYSSVRRAAFARGFTAVTTMTETDEHAAALLACGWTPDEPRPSRSGWDTPTRRRGNTANPSRTRWWCPGSNRTTPAVIMPSPQSDQPRLLEVP